MERPEKEKGNIQENGAFNQFLLLLKTDYIHLKLVNWRKELVCQNNSSGTSSLLMVTDCLGKIFTRINLARQRVRENHSSGTESLDKVTGCLEKLLWTNDWKKNKIVLKLAPGPLEKETPPMYGNRCSFDKKRKSCPYKAGMNRLKSCKGSNLLLWKLHSLKLFLNSSNSLLPTTTVPDHWRNFSTKPAYDHISVLNLYRNWNIFPFAGNNVQVQKIRTSIDIHNYIGEHTGTRFATLICIVTLITVGVPNRLTWLTEPTPYLQTLAKRPLFYRTHENLANCNRSTLKMWRAVKYSIQNLTRAWKVHLKSDTLSKL